MRTVTGSAAALAIAISTRTEADAARRRSDQAATGWGRSAPKPERREAPGRRHAVGVPAAQRVVVVEHRGELRRRTVHSGGRPIGDGLVHHFPGQDVLRSAHALAHVEEPLEVDDALADALELVDGHVPAGD